MIRRGNMIEDVYKKIKDTKNKYGTYYKTVFHLHTPESYDYKLRKEWKSEEYKKKTVEEIFQECVSDGLGKSEEELFFLAYLRPIKIMNPRYKTNAIIFAISSPDTVSSKTLRILINFNHYKQNMKLCNHLSY